MNVEVIFLGWFISWKKKNPWLCTLILSVLILSKGSYCRFFILYSSFSIRVGRTINKS